MFFNGSLVCFKDKYNSKDSFNFLYKVYSFSSGKVGITAGGNYYSSCPRKLREATEVEIQLNRRVGEYHTKTSLLKELYSHIDLEVGDKIRVLRECSPYYKKGTILQLQKKNDHCGWTFTSDTNKRHLGFRLASIYGDHLSEGFGWERVMKCTSEGKQIFKELYFKPTSVEQS